MMLAEAAVMGRMVMHSMAPSGVMTCGYAHGARVMTADKVAQFRQGRLY
jgi:hypothetical protein